MMRLLSIQVGRVQSVPYRRDQVTTGIFKAPVAGAVMVRRLNLDGDEQADLRVHGGPDKAVYAYGADAYPAWQRVRPKDEFKAGAMGENLTFDVLDEDQIFIGDSYQIGGVQLQVAQPRQPCFKLGIKYNDPKIVAEFMQIGRPGVYFRVLQEGLIEAGQELTRIHAEKVRVSVRELFLLIGAPSVDQQRVQDMLSIPSLPAYWRTGLSNLST